MLIQLSLGKFDFCFHPQFTTEPEFLFVQIASATSQNVNKMNLTTENDLDITIISVHIDFY